MTLLVEFEYGSETRILRLEFRSYDELRAAAFLTEVLKLARKY